MCILLLIYGILPAHAQHPAEDSNAVKIYETLSEKYRNLSADSAIMYQEAALGAAISLKVPAEVICRIYMKLGILYRVKAEFGRALSADLQALRLAESGGWTSLSGSACNSVGIDYYRNGDLSNAEVYFIRGLTLRLQTTDTAAVADSYYNLGMLSDDQGKPVQALKYYNTALELFREARMPDGEADVFNGMAGIYYSLGKPDSTAFFAGKALQKFEEAGNREAMAFMLINIAGLNNMLKKHREAEQNILKGIEIARSLGALSQLRQGYKSLSETYALMGDYKKAYENLGTYQFYADSIFNREKSGQFQELQAKYESEKKERIIRQKEGEAAMNGAVAERNRNQRNLMMLVAAFALVLLLIIVYRYFEKRKSGKLLEMKNSELRKLNATKDRLFSIISHDLRSPVSAFERLTGGVSLSFDRFEREQLKEYIAEMNRSSKEIRLLLSNLLQWSMSQTGELSPRPENLSVTLFFTQLFESMQSEARPAGVELCMRASDSAGFCCDRRMAEIIFRNLIGNAIKFSPSDQKVEVEADVDGGICCLRILDRGPGMTGEQSRTLFADGNDLHALGGGLPGKGAGLGLVLCRELILLNRGSVRASLREGGGMEISVQLPESC